MATEKAAAEEAVETNQAPDATEVLAQLQATAAHLEEVVQSLPATERHNLLKQIDGLKAAIGEAIVLLDRIEQLPNTEAHQRGPIAREAMALLRKAL